MDIAITKMSSKGQIVIPAEMRKNIQEGEKLLIIGEDDKFIVKKASKMDKNLEEDLEFAKRTEAAYMEIEKGNFKQMSSEKFLKELKRW